MEYITVTREEAKNLKKRYIKAVEKNEYSFEFNDRTFLTSYAKYVVEYLEGKFGKL